MAGTFAGKTIELSVSGAFSSASQTAIQSFDPSGLMLLEIMVGARPDDISARMDSMSPAPIGMVLVRSELAQKEEQDRATWTFPMTVLMARIGSEVVNFPEPLEATLRMGGLGYVLDVPFLDIHATGRDIPEIQDNLNEQIEVRVDLYLHAPDSRLSPDAIELKRKLALILPGL